MGTQATKAKAVVPETASLVRVFLKMRAARSAIKEEYDAKDDKLKEDMKKIEVELLRRAQEQGVEGFKTADGTTYKAEEAHASIEDSDAFYSFLEDPELADPYGFFEQRASLKRIKEYQSAHATKDEDGNVLLGPPPPGIRLFREERMRVRANNGNDKKGEG